jgi:hypothetical protein
VFAGQEPGRVAQGTVEPELGPVVVVDALKVGVIGLGQRLQGIDHFKRPADQHAGVAQGFDFAEIFHTPLVGQPGFLNATLGRGHAHRSRCELGMGPGDLGRHQILNAEQLDQQLLPFGPALAHQSAVA